MFARYRTAALIAAAVVFGVAAAAPVTIPGAPEIRSELPPIDNAQQIIPVFGKVFGPYISTEIDFAFRNNLSLRIERFVIIGTNVINPGISAPLLHPRVINPNIFWEQPGVPGEEVPDSVEGVGTAVLTFEFTDFGQDDLFTLNGASARFLSRA